MGIRAAFGPTVDFLPGLVQLQEKEVQAMKARSAKFQIGQVVRHRIHPFRGVIFDVDPEYDNTEEWWNSIPEASRPRKDQPYYHLLAENDHTEYVAYVSEQNLEVDETGLPVRHPQVVEIFDKLEQGIYHPRERLGH